MQNFQNGQIGQVRDQITSTKSQDVKKVVLEGIQGDPIGNTGCSKKMQNFQNGQIGQVRGQIICKLSKDLKKQFLGGCRVFQLKIQGVPKNKILVKIAKLGK